jgi:hypothetical protein
MHPVLAHVSKATVEWLLVQAGAIQGLESLQSEDVYQLLLELPERDPEGQHAPGVYRALLREGASGSQSSLRETFLSTGKLWGSHNRRSQYMGVQKLRYLDGSFVPRALLAGVRLFDAPPRQKGRV